MEGESSGTVSSYPAEDISCDELFVLTECDEDERCDETAEKDSPLIPSKVTSRDYIYYPTEMEDFEEREEWKRSGKWLLFSKGDLNLLDDLWTRLLPLVGVVSCIKSSTATDPVAGVIMVYTQNYEDKASVKRAADAIRGVVDIDHILYYKTNEASDSGLYRMHGDSHIAKYMHTVAGSLYERDPNNSKFCISYTAIQCINKVCEVLRKA